jgi:protein-arginine kinase activator protein McsA
MKEEEKEKINCEICGITLNSYKKHKHKKVCSECFTKINEK